MPCYLFTYHGHGTWLPDHPRGYVHRTRGQQPPDSHMAAHYRANLRTEEVLFDAARQRVVIEAARNVEAFIHAAVHAVATEPTHVHVLASWRHRRTWASMRTSIRGALSRSLAASFGRRTWFSGASSGTSVRSQEHFDYLVLKYLSDHGTSWVRDADRTAAAARDALREVSVRFGAIANDQ